MIRLRPLSDESVYTCDWGYCDDVAVAERATGDPTQPWLSVCRRHAYVVDGARALDGWAGPFDDPAGGDDPW